MNHKPWLDVFQASLSWFFHHLQTKNPNSGTRGHVPLYISYLKHDITCSTLSVSQMVSLARKQMPEWLTEASGGSQHQVFSHLCWAEPCHLPRSEDSLMINEIMAGFYFMAQMSSSAETIVILRARAPALFLTVPSRASLVGNRVAS